jgi:hypothetical protein
VISAPAAPPVPFHLAARNSGRFAQVTRISGEIGFVIWRAKGGNKQAIILPYFCGSFRLGICSRAEFD